MFENIGKKIKALAETMCWVGIVICVLIGVMLIVITNIILEEITPGFVICGILIIIIGSLFSWISSFYIYGFGEAVDRLTSIDKKITEIVEDKKTIEEEYENNYIIDDGFIPCVSCGANVSGDKTVCHVCGTEIHK